MVVAPLPLLPLLEAGWAGVLLLVPPNTTVGMASGVELDPQAESANANTIVIIKYVFFILSL
jgi:hypothetical protein